MILFFTLEARANPGLKNDCAVEPPSPPLTLVTHTNYLHAAL